MATYLTARHHINQLIGATTFMHSYLAPNDDGPGAYEGHEWINGAAGVWDHLVLGRSSDWRPKPDDLLKLKTVEDVIKALKETFDDSEWIIRNKVETAEQFDARKADERRRELEQAASEIARRHNCSVNSLDFLSACASELNRFSAYRHGMREDGLCIGYGVTFDQWNEEYNCSMGDSDQVNEILEWVATECPLLWAKYQESKLRGDDDLLS